MNEQQGSIAEPEKESVSENNEDSQLTSKNQGGKDEEVLDSSKPISEMEEPGQKEDPDVTEKRIDIEEPVQTSKISVSQSPVNDSDDDLGLQDSDDESEENNNATNLKEQQGSNDAKASDQAEIQKEALDGNDDDLGLHEFSSDEDGMFGSKAKKTQSANTKEPQESGKPKSD